MIYFKKMPKMKVSVSNAASKKCSYSVPSASFSKPDPIEYPESDEEHYVEEEIDDVKTEVSDEINVVNDDSVPTKVEVHEGTYQTEEFQVEEQTDMNNVIELGVEGEPGQLEETHIEEFIYEVEEQVEEQESAETEEIAIEHVYDKRKEMEEFFVDNLDEEYMDDDDPNDEEDDKKVQLLETMNEDNIDIFEYKKMIIKVDPTETNLKHSLFCVVSFFFCLLSTVGIFTTYCTFENKPTF